jgi:hypothetical protein
MQARSAVARSARGIFLALIDSLSGIGGYIPRIPFRALF